MDSEQLEKWQKIMKALEEAGKTDCFIYRRASAVVKTGKDPGPPFKTEF